MCPRYPALGSSPPPALGTQVAPGEVTRCHHSFRQRTFPPRLFLQGCSQRSAKASSLVRARRVVTKLTKGNSSPALAVTVLPLRQTTTKLALGDVGEAFRSLHGSFNDDLEMKCCRNLSTLLVPDPGKVWPFNCEGNQHRIPHGQGSSQTSQHLAGRIG